MEFGGPTVFCNEKLAVKAPKLAVTMYALELFVLSAVKTGEVAVPAEVVTTVVVVTPPGKVPLAPVVGGAVNVTVSPPTGLPKVSLRMTTNGAANAAPICALCGVPLTTVMEVAGPGAFVKLKLVETPPMAAVTLYDPATVLAVKEEAVAVPVESVRAVLTPPAKVPLAPVVGGVKVMV